MNNLTIHLYTESELIERIVAFNMSTSTDYTIQETKNEFPKLFANKEESAKEWLAIIDSSRKASELLEENESLKEQLRLTTLDKETCGKNLTNQYKENAQLKQANKELLQGLIQAKNCLVPSDYIIKKSIEEIIERNKFKS